MDFTFTNITIQLFSGFMLTIILICILISSDKLNRLNRTFIIVTVLIIGILLFDVLAWWLDEKPGAVFRCITIISNFFVYLFGVIGITVFTKYITLSIPMDKRIVRRAMRISWGIVGVAFIMFIANLYYGWFYYIDSDNVYHWGEFIEGPYLVFFLLYAIQIILIISYWKQLGLRSALTYLLYVLLPTISVFINFIYIDFMIAQPMIAMSLFIVFVNIHIQREKLMKEQEIKLKNKEISIMLSQIQPHFLYNALVVIRQLCRIDPKLAEETVVEFSNYLRGNLDSLTENKLIPFEQELHHVETYLNIEKKRFGKKINIIYNVKVKDFDIPALILQPIAENAVRYGITKKERGGTIEIKTEETESCFIITVTDDGAGFDVNNNSKNDERSHIGIENTRSRLASMCSGTLEIQSEPGKGTTAIIRIPK